MMPLTLRRLCVKQCGSELRDLGLLETLTPSPLVTDDAVDSVPPEAVLNARAAQDGSSSDRCI